MSGAADLPTLDEVDAAIAREDAAAEREARIVATRGYVAAILLILEPIALRAAEAAAASVAGPGGAIAIELGAKALHEAVDEAAASVAGKPA